MVLACRWLGVLLWGVTSCTQPMRVDDDAPVLADTPMASADTPTAVDTAPAMDAPTAMDVPASDVPADATARDAPTPSDADVAECNRLFGAVPGYVLCWATPMACVISAAGPGLDCSEVCDLGGVSADCVTAYAAGADACALGASRSCATDTPGICICRL
jgi:hypothetical protein